tara:strand:- start:859 stop:1074 length:216 start_codon:yes stop_codon:yes gene_type:complete
MHAENTENQIKIPTNAIPSYIAWLRHHRDQLCIQYDKLRRTKAWSPSINGILLSEIDQTKAVLEDILKQKG